MAGILCDTGDKMCLTGLSVPGFSSSSNGAQRERFPGSPTRRYPRQVLTAVATGMLLTERGNACLTRRTSGFTLRLCADEPGSDPGESDFWDTPPEYHCSG